MSLNAFLSETLNGIFPSCNVFCAVPTLCYFELAAEEVSDNVALPLMTQQMLKGGSMQLYPPKPLLNKSTIYEEWGPSQEEFDAQYEAQLRLATDEERKTMTASPRVNIVTKFHSSIARTRFWHLALMPDGTLVSGNISSSGEAVCCITPDGDCFETPVKDFGLQILRSPVVVADDLVGFLAHPVSKIQGLFVVFRILKTKVDEMCANELSVVEEKRYNLISDKADAATLVNPNTLLIVGDGILNILDLKTGKVTASKHGYGLVFGVCLFRSPASVAQGATPQSCLCMFSEHANCEIVVFAAYHTTEFHCVTHNASLGTVHECGSNIVDVALLPNGLVAVASTSSDSIHVCDPSKMAVVKKYGQMHCSCGIAVLPGGQHIAVVLDNDDRRNSNCFMIKLQ